MPLWRQFLCFLRAICYDWVARMTGIGSFLSGLSAAVLDTPLSHRIFWPVAYFCLIVAAFRVWQKGRNFKEYDEARRQIKHLTPRERELVGLLLSRCQMTDRQIGEAGFQDIVTDILRHNTTFLDRKPSSGALFIIQPMVGPVSEAMNDLHKSSN